MAAVYPQPLVTVTGVVVQARTDTWEAQPAQAAEVPSLANPAGRRARNSTAAGSKGIVVVMVPASIADKVVSGVQAGLEIRCYPEQLAEFGEGEAVSLRCKLFPGFTGTPGNLRRTVDVVYVDRAETNESAEPLKVAGAAGRRR